VRLINRFILEDEAKKWIKNISKDPTITIVWIIDKKKGNVIGIFGIIKSSVNDLEEGTISTSNFNKKLENLPKEWSDLHPIEISYLLEQNSWGKGIATGNSFFRVA
jgi:hypothetical protein